MYNAFNVFMKLFCHEPNLFYEPLIIDRMLFKCKKAYDDLNKYVSMCKIYLYRVLH